MDEQYKYPPKMEMKFYRRGCVWRSTKWRRIDLADFLMLSWPAASLSVTMGLTTSSVRWRVWDEKRLSSIENLVKYDLDFDGYNISMKRITELGAPCSEEFLWRVRIK